MNSMNSILYNICTDKIVPSKQTVKILRSLQHKVDEAIAMTKTAWSRHLDEVIHYIPFNPKDTWQNIKSLCCGEKSHHSSPKIIQMKLPSDKLAETTKIMWVSLLIISVRYWIITNQRTTMSSKKLTYARLCQNWAVHYHGKILNLQWKN